MRYIDINALEHRLPKEWRAKLKNISNSMDALKPDERAKLIETNSKVWRAHKDKYETYSFNKCWYCETRQERTDNAIEHYRPKSKLEDDPSHPGYWWLAFDWENYRYSCDYCNVRRGSKRKGTAAGKGSSFPLQDPAQRAYKPGLGELKKETPLLLDPAQPRDPQHLWFDVDGSAVPHPINCSDEKSLPYVRATTSINKYNLNHGPTCEKRKVIARAIDDLVRRGNAASLKAASGDTEAQEAFDKIITELCQKIRQEAEYSAAARSYLQLVRRTIDAPWVDEVTRAC